MLVYGTAGNAVTPRNCKVKRVSARWQSESKIEIVTRVHAVNTGGRSHLRAKSPVATWCQTNGLSRVKKIQRFVEGNE